VREQAEMLRDEVHREGRMLFTEVLGLGRARSVVVSIGIRGIEGVDQGGDHREADVNGPARPAARLCVDGLGGPTRRRPGNDVILNIFAEKWTDVGWHTRRGTGRVVTQLHLIQARRSSLNERLAYSRSRRLTRHPIP
jgi:hypothetical protein